MPLVHAVQAPEPPPAPDIENHPRIGRSLVLAKALTHLPVSPSWGASNYLPKPDILHSPSARNGVKPCPHSLLAQ